MATLFSETWPDSNGTVWNSTRWPYSSGTGSATQQSNKGRLTAGATQWNSITYGTDVLSSADVKTLIKITPVQANVQGSISWRWDSTANTRYYLDWVNSSAIYLYSQVNNGSATFVTQIASTTVMDGTAFYVRIEHEGNTLRIRAWKASGAEPGSWDYNATASTVTAAGRFAVNLANNGTSGTTQSIDFDAITIEDFVTVQLTQVRPSSTISSTGWTVSGAASAHAAVNESTPSDSEYVQGVAS